MRNARVMVLSISTLVLLFCGHAQSDQCTLQFISHGAFARVDTPEGECLRFIDDLGQTWEVVNDRAVWTDGLEGTLFAEFVEGEACAADTVGAVQICDFFDDFSRNFVGTLEFLDAGQIRCPGFFIFTNADQRFRIENCDDFGDTLCSFDNVGRFLRAMIHVNTGPTFCISEFTEVEQFVFLDEHP